jgi:3-oxoacyl-(acyl-carrier-protein) synthase
MVFCPLPPGIPAYRNMRRVVITGLGVVAPTAHGIDPFADALREGRSGIQHQPEMAALNFSCHVAGVPADTDALRDRYFDPATQVGMDPSTVLGCVAGLDCWEDAGFRRDRSPFVDWDTGVTLGTGIGALETVGKTLVPATDAGRVRRLGSAVPERIMCSAASARLAGLLGTGGPAYSNSSACSTGAEAIIQAYWAVREGRIARVLAGGCEGPSVYTWAAFDAMRVLSRNFNDAPDRASRPLSATACGFVPAAGAGVVMVEALDSALARGARIYAEIAGASVNCGGQRNGGTMTLGNPEGVRRAIRAALHDADLQPSDIDLISGHLTGTIGDPLELRNWRCALELPEDRFPYVNAPKSLFGHALGAAGAIESIAAILQLDRAFVHPSRNCEDLHPDLAWCEPRIPRTAVDEPLNVVAKASFGFGDVNSCILFRKF